MNVPVAGDTICARATAAGRAGVTVIRLSGPAVPAVAVALAGALPPPRQATLRAFRDAEGQSIDVGLLLYFPAPRSFTGEGVLELHAHGGHVVAQMLLERLQELGARLAEPGEFSQRAFLNDKLDLSQAEAIADLIDSQSTDNGQGVTTSFGVLVHSVVSRFNAGNGYAMSRGCLLYNSVSQNNGAGDTPGQILIMCDHQDSLSLLNQALE